jgi:alkanesulfonate monooxygenase SsuD/methylene tetrahydromethanopterin reductase-like flavin-dependent oxidoreductase (luciferase family)
MGVGRHVYVGTSDDRAWEECAEHVHNAFQAPPTPGERIPARERDALRHSERSFSYKTEQHQHRATRSKVDFEELEREGYLIVGSPDTVVRKIKEQQEALGVGFFLPYLPFGSMEPDQALRSVELFGKEVLPHLRD